MDNGTVSSRRALVILSLSGILVALMMAAVLAPARKQISKRYLIRGDKYLVAQQFEPARREYQQALDYDPDNATARQMRDLAQKAPTDIALARDFFQARGVVAVTEKLDQAQQKYSHPKDALQAGVDFFQAGEFVYAQYPLRQATKLDNGYPEAWHYLGLTYQELAKKDSSLQALADEAFKRRDLLTPNYLE